MVPKPLLSWKGQKEFATMEKSNLLRQGGDNVMGTAFNVGLTPRQGGGAERKEEKGVFLGRSLGAQLKSKVTKPEPASFRKIPLQEGCANPRLMATELWLQYTGLLLVWEGEHFNRKEKFKKGRGESFHKGY